jgi:thioredoxin reductase (NADPH)
MYDLIIIGGGPAGYSAALYGARFKLKVLILTQERGGRLKLTDMIENYPGAPSITGTKLMDIMEKQATQFGGEIRDEKVKGLVKDGDNLKVVTERDEYITKTIVIATGVNVRKLNVPGEKEFENRGVSYCAVCDGALFSGKIVSVIGGSDSAAKEALLLTQYAKKECHMI